MKSGSVRNYWKRPIAVLAGMELVVFGAALCLISLARFDGDSPLAEREVAEVLARSLLFAPVLSLAMAATGLYMTGFYGIPRAKAFAIGQDRNTANVLFKDAVAMCRGPIPATCASMGTTPCAWNCGRSGRWIT